MTVPLSVHPIRRVPTELDPQWTVAIHRGGKWPGWRWWRRLLDGIDRLNPDDSGLIAVVGGVVMLIGVPGMVTARAKYLAQRRTDWEVLIFVGMQSGDYRPDKAVLVESVPTRDAAVERGDQHCARLATGWTPTRTR